VTVIYTAFQAGSVEERRSYDAFGQRRNPVWGDPPPAVFASKTSFGFTGHESDADLGLVNMRGRLALDDIEAKTGQRPGMIVSRSLPVPVAEINHARTKCRPHNTAYSLRGVAHS
jgi:hypothetical protein